MNHDNNFFLRAALSEIKISEEQYDHISLIAYNARIEIEKHIKKRYETYTDGEAEITDTTIILNVDDLLFIFKNNFE